jgi:hypothetical protein
MKVFAFAASFLIFCFTAACGGDSPSADAAPGAHADAAPGTPDATPGGPADAAIGVACGAAATCSTSQECCVTANGDGGTSMCISPGTCQGISARCDGPEDCGGHACCGGVNPQTGMAAVMCIGTDACGAGQIQACHEDTDCPAQGQAAGKCCVAGTTGYCKATCP